MTICIGVRICGCGAKIVLSGLFHQLCRMFGLTKFGIVPKKTGFDVSVTIPGGVVWLNVAFYVAHIVS